MAEKTEDLNLPLSVISRIIKDAMPEGVLVSKEARLAISRAASVFVLHATTYANQNALANKRKTLTSTDVLAGVRELELDDFIAPLEEALGAWRAEQKRKTEAKKAAKSGGGETECGYGEAEGETEVVEEEEDEPAEKSTRQDDDEDDYPPTLQAQDPGEEEGAREDSTLGSETSE